MFGVLESEPGMVGANAMLNVLFLCQIYIYIFFFFGTTTRKASYVRVYTVASALTVTGWFFLCRDSDYFWDSVPPGAAMLIHCFIL